MAVYEAVELRIAREEIETLKSVLEWYRKERVRLLIECAKLGQSVTNLQLDNSNPAL